MREIKTYENFITNLFTKNKKLPSEMYDLSGSLVSIISYYFNNILNKDFYIRYFEVDSKNKKGYNSITIIADEVYKIVRLYYGKNLNDIMFDLIDCNSHDTDSHIANIKDFL